MKRKQKIGLVLGGGGGKGAYQIGVWKALKEYKIDKYINYVSATSIGSLNSLLFLSGDLNKAINMWEKVNKNTALSKKSFKDMVFKKSIFSREGFIKLADDNIDFKKVSKSKINAFVTATPVSKKMANAPSNFCLNGRSKEEILNIVLASSAIPVIFEPVVIDGVKYRDGYMIDNNPVSVLKEKGCSLIFVVPLKEYSEAYKWADDKTVIIDFVSGYNDYGIIDGTLDFVSDRAKMRMRHGYEVGKQLIEYVISEGVVAVTLIQKIMAVFKKIKKRKENKRSYYCLTKEEIRHRPG